MLIRQADPLADLENILLVADGFARLANRPDLFPAPGSEQMIGLIEKLMAIPGYAVLLAEHDGQVCGGIGFWIGPYLMSVDKIEVQEHFWWAAEDAPPRAAMLLLREAMRRADEAGASVRTMHRLLTSPDGVDAAYRRFGLTPIQVTYIGVK